MKKILKKILPDSMINIAVELKEKYFSRRRPKLRVFRGEDESVLQCCIAYNKFGGYCVPLSSCYRPAAQRILSGKVYESKTIAFLTSHCGDGDVVHGGTFFGDFIPALSRALAPGYKLWAFEPNSENYLCAFITMKINRCNNVEIKNAAIGKSRGFTKVMVNDPKGRALGGASRIISENEAETGNTQKVEIFSIDEAVPPDRIISIIHLDVEGYEKEALSGALKTINRCKPVIVLEALPEESWLKENILKIGYKISGKVGNNTILSIS